MSPESPNHQAPGTSAKECALVLHEDVAVSRLIREAMERFTIAEVVTTPDAEYAFELALQRDYKLFVFHLNAPVLGGELLYELISKAYRHCGTGYRKLPAVIYLGDSQDSLKYEELLRDARVKGILMKPLSIERLLERAGSVLAKREDLKEGKGNV
jgi:DNA-binding response OmpR family regulator